MGVKLLTGAKWALLEETGAGMKLLKGDKWALRPVTAGGPPRGDCGRDGVRSLLMGEIISFNSASNFETGGSWTPWHGVGLP